MSYRYQNTSDSELVLMGFGTVAAGAEIIAERPIENPNFKYLGKVEPVVGTQAAQPNAVTEATLQNNEEIN